VTLLCQNPHNHSSGATARLVSEGFCDCFMDSWFYFSEKTNCQVGSISHGEEYAATAAAAATNTAAPHVDEAQIVTSICFFVGCETLALICGNTNVNSTMNSTLNKGQFSAYCTAQIESFMCSMCVLHLACLVCA
jgi:hypothetical protein